ncbi:hypothetical protein [Blastococcus sp. SYSU DS0619]
MTSTRSVAAVGRGVLAGVAGTAVMTAFQKLVEMPLTGRRDSYAPAELAERLLGARPATARGRTVLNYAAHFSLGTMWGAAYGVAARRGLRGQRAVHAVFAVVYPADVAVSTALGIYAPGAWTLRDLAVDVAGKYVQAQGTGLVFDRLLDPA